MSSHLDSTQAIYSMCAVKGGTDSLVTIDMLCYTMIAWLFKGIHMAQLNIRIDDALKEEGEGSGDAVENLY